MIPDFSGGVVLFGGSFDPVHSGHLHVAAAVRNSLTNVEIVFVPAAQSPGKISPVASDELRLGWLQAATSEYGFKVWDTELKRGSVSYTVDTLESARELGAKRDRTFLLLGADAYASFKSWKQAERIRHLARLIVVQRPGSDLQIAEREDIALKLEPHPASSTAVRDAIAGDQPVAGLLPPKVALELEKLTLLSQNPYARKKE